MKREKQIEEMAEILAKNFTLYDGVTTFCAGDFEWCAYQLMENGYRKERQGEWIKTKTGFICSNCGEHFPSNRLKYCYECGAKMRGE